MNAKISVFVICVEGIIYFLLYNLHDCTFKNVFLKDFGMFRSSRPEVFYKSILRNFSKFTGVRHRCIPMNFAKFLKTPFYRTPLGDCFFVVVNSAHIKVQ